MSIHLTDNAVLAVLMMMLYVALNYERSQRNDLGDYTV